MKFVDSVKIHIRSGKGGSGCTSFLHLRGKPKGGPDGGDGGNGGSVIFRGNSNKTTLLDLSFQQHQHAEDGKAGGGQNKHGRSGHHRFISVPLGTVIKDIETEEILMEVVEEKEYLFLKGGRGGKGNSKFRTSTNRAPEFHQPGEDGIEMWVRLELKLMADVGLVGFPNAGKSTLISSISHAHPKVADYPFTTLVPNLGVVKRSDFDSFVVADIPGIIEGAHDGIGLGDRFLKHIERTAILVFLLDVSGFAEHPPFEEFQILLKELKLFSEALIKKPRMVALNKMDAISDTAEVQEIKYKLEQAGETVFLISGISGTNIEPLLKELADVVKKVRIQRNQIHPITFSQ